MQKLIPARSTRERLGGISTMTEWRRRKEGILPPVITISGRNFDREHEVDAIINAYAAGASDDDVRAIVELFVAERVASGGNKN